MQVLINSKYCNFGLFPNIYTTRFPPTTMAPIYLQEQRNNNILVSLFIHKWFIYTPKIIYETFQTIGEAFYPPQIHRGTSILDTKTHGHCMEFIND